MSVASRVISTTSGGPALTVFDPDKVGVTNPIPGINLLYYPTPTTPLDCISDGACKSDVFNLTSRVLGGGFVPNSRTVFFVEGHGTGRYCYDTAAGCGDPVMTDVKGPHAQPYRYQILAYDAKDLLAVKNGAKKPWEVRPYNFSAPWVLHQFDGEDPRGSAAALTQKQAVSISVRQCRPTRSSMFFRWRCRPELLMPFRKLAQSTHGRQSRLACIMHGHELPSVTLPSAASFLSRRAISKQNHPIRIGGRLTAPPLRHHRAYGSVPRRFSKVKCLRTDPSIRSEPNIGSSVF